MLFLTIGCPVKLLPGGGKNKPIGATWGVA